MNWRLLGAYPACSGHRPDGRAADRPEWLLQPWQIVPVMDELAD